MITYILGGGGFIMKKLGKEKVFSQSEEEVLGRAFWNLVNHYGFTREQQSILLGLPNYRQRLVRLEKEHVIPKDVDKKNRVGLLLGIHKNLRIMYPHNREIVYNWMNYPQEILGGLIPIDFITEDPLHSYERLAFVRRRLDYVRCAQ